MRIFLVVLPLLASCDDHLIGVSNDRSNCDRDPPLTYENFGAAFLAEYCTGCHGSLQKESQRSNAPAGVDFDSWAAVLEWSPRISERALGSRDMPPAGQPGIDELSRFDEWMECEVLPASGVFL